MDDSETYHKMCDKAPWLPASSPRYPHIEDWIGMMPGNYWSLERFRRINRYNIYVESVSKNFEAETLEQALCLAVGWTRGWKWDGEKWERP